MKINKRILYSLGIIAVLLIYLLVSGDRKSEDIIDVKSWEGEADEIVINKEDKPIRIYKKEDKWVIDAAAYPADDSIVSQLIEKMKELKIIDFISRKEHYQRYDLSQDKAIRVTVSKENEILRDVLVGKKSPAGRSSYIKFFEKPEIYLASGWLINDYNKSVEDIRDKKIYEISEDAVESIELNYNRKKISFSKVLDLKKKDDSDQDIKDKDKVKIDKKKNEDKWICNEYKNVELDNNKVKSFVTDAISIRANSFPNIDIKTLRKPESIVSIKALGRSIDLKLFHKGKEKDDEKMYICSSSESPYVFTLSEWKAKKFLKSLSDFVVKTKKKKVKK
ncbi:MAG: DUF4340 domain-containing protein [Spirochaetota bacterium]|nr:DUF4340 domain-containing protein [Spirochaetota bacterium]